MISLFRKKIQPKEIKIDIHSHLLPGLDDGVSSLEESESILKRFIDLGYEKVITTPHIMSDFYQNTPEKINESYQKLIKHLKEKEIAIKVEFAAEYYLDDYFLKLLMGKEDLLTFGDKYLLFEMPMISQSLVLEETIFNLQSMGYKPVLAHPERYPYYFGDYKKLKSIYDRGVLFQVNINSIGEYYSKPSKMIVQKLAKDKMIDFIGSDCHGRKHIEFTQKVRSSRLYAEISNLELKNNTL